MNEIRVAADSPITLTIAGAVVYLYAFWVLYIAVMGAYRAHLDGRLVGAARWLAYPLVIVGFAVDALCQYTLAVVLFADWPAQGEHLVTDRLQRYVATGYGWRYRASVYICDNVLDIFDPRGGHC